MSGEQQAKPLPFYKTAAILCGESVPMFAEWRQLKRLTALPGILGRRFLSCTQFAARFTNPIHLYNFYRNTAEVLYTVRCRPLCYGHPPQTMSEMPTWLHRAQELPSYQRFWFLEGVAFEIAYRQQRANPNIKGLFDQTLAHSLPENTHLIVQVGICLALITAHLEKLHKKEDIPTIIDRAVAACYANSKNESYAEAGLDCLGFYARPYKGALYRHIADYIAHKHPRLTELFWTGVGRGSYFLPTSFIPGASNCIFRELAAEIKDPTQRTRAFAGLAFAVILINAETPATIQKLWLHDKNVDFLADPGFQSGAYYAALLRNQTTPNAANFTAIRAHQGGPTYQKLIVEPIQAAQKTPSTNLTTNPAKTLTKLYSP